MEQSVLCHHKQVNVICVLNCPVTIYKVHISVLSAGAGYHTHNSANTPIADQAEQQEHSIKNPASKAGFKTKPSGVSRSARFQAQMIPITGP